MKEEKKKKKKKPSRLSPCSLALTFLKIKYWSNHVGMAMGQFWVSKLEPNPNSIPSSCIACTPTQLFT